MPVFSVAKIDELLDKAAEALADAIATGSPVAAQEWSAVIGNLQIVRERAEEMG
jgi:hypothetical protein